MRKAALNKGARLGVKVILDAPDGEVQTVEQQIGRTRISIIGKTDAARVGNSHSRKAPDVRAMDMGVYRDGGTKRAIDRF